MESFLKLFKGGKTRRRQRGSYKKGSKSKTYKGDLDFTTKKGDHDYHRKGHDLKLRKRPFTLHKKKGKKGRRSAKM
tara:strand:+ start:133 stop:360 length:228 start_codon:yes stop_codon:yes gene_type:complete